MKTKELIIEYVDAKGITDKEELVALIQDKVEVPEHKDLERRYLESLISRAVATVRDEEGRRCILAKRSAADTQYINLGRCENLDILQDIKKRMEKDINGRRKSMKKVDLRITAVQLNLFKVLDGERNAQ